MQAHSLFLQAAGMPARDTASVVRTGVPRSPSLRQRELVRFAEQLTRCPPRFGPRDLQRIRDVIADDGELIEALNVVAGFNFANRVADSLAIPREIPDWFETHPLLHTLAFEVMSRAIRWRMNFSPRTLPARDCVLVLSELEFALASGDMGRPPRYVYRLSARPHILEQHAVMLRTLLLSDLPKTLIRKVGLLVCALNGDGVWAAEWRRQLDRGPLPADRDLVLADVSSWASSSLERNGLCLARQVTLDAAITTDAQFEALRECGLDDHDLLAFVLVAAGFNAASRLNIALDAAMTTNVASGLPETAG
jgi:alkylhydroperoxidase family enzyme